MSGANRRRPNATPRRAVVAPIVTTTARTPTAKPFVLSWLPPRRVQTKSFASLATRHQRRQSRHHCALGAYSPRLNGIRRATVCERAPHFCPPPFTNLKGLNRRVKSFCFDSAARRLRSRHLDCLRVRLTESLPRSKLHRFVSSPSDAEWSEAELRILLFLRPTLLKRVWNSMGAAAVKLGSAVRCQRERTWNLLYSWGFLPQPPCTLQFQTELDPANITENYFSGVVSTLRFNLDQFPNGILDLTKDGTQNKDFVVLYSCVSSSNFVGPSVNATTKFQVECKYPVLTFRVRTRISRALFHTLIHPLSTEIRRCPGQRPS